MQLTFGRRAEPLAAAAAAAAAVLREPWSSPARVSPHTRVHGGRLRRLSGMLLFFSFVSFWSTAQNAAKQRWDSSSEGGGCSGPPLGPRGGSGGSCRGGSRRGGVVPLTLWDRVRLLPSIT